MGDLTEVRECLSELANPDNWARRTLDGSEAVIWAGEPEVSPETFASSALAALLAVAPSSPLLSREEIGRGWFFKLGDRVRKIKGSSWQGRVVGFYSTKLTPSGYAVESEREPGSVQIYPEGALEAVEKPSLATVEVVEWNKE